MQTTQLRDTNEELVWNKLNFMCIKEVIVPKVKQEEQRLRRNFRRKVVILITDY
jgi:hypothetical protein